MKWPTTIFGQKSNVSHEDLQGMFISGDFRTCCQPVELVQFSAFTFWTFQLKQNAHQLRRRQVDNSPEKNKWKFQWANVKQTPLGCARWRHFLHLPIRIGGSDLSGRVFRHVTVYRPPPPLLQRSINFQLFDRRESEQLITSEDFHSLRGNKRRHTATVTTCTRVLPLFCSPLDFSDKTTWQKRGKTSQIR